MASLEVRPERDALVVIMGTPWRLHRGLLFATGLFGVLVLLGGGLFVPLLMMTDLFPAASEMLRPLLSSWVFWLFVALGVLLLALDRRSRRQVVWRADRLRMSWMFGPLDLLPVEYRHDELPTLEVIERRVPRLLASIFGDQGGDWVVGWRLVTDPSRPPYVRELARSPSAEAAEQLRQRLLAWRGVEVASTTPSPSTSSSFKISDLASLGINRVLLWPLAMIVGLCLVPIGLAVESIAVARGWRAQTLPWDSTAQATLERLNWRVTRGTRRTNYSGREIDVAEYGAHLQAVVSFVDADGHRQVRPLGLAIPGSGEYLLSGHIGPAYVIEKAAQAGLRLTPIRFELPRDILPAEVDADGTLRLDTIATDPSAEVMTPAYLLHWNLVVHLDRPSVFLPLSWSEPSLPATFPIVYRAGADPESAVLPESLASALGPRLVDFDGDLHEIGMMAFVIGGFMFAQFMPRGRRLWVGLPLWVAICASSLYWDRLSDRAAALAGIDRGLSVRLRDRLVALKMPATSELSTIDDGVAVGEWSPSRSRHRALLALLDLTQPPATRYPDFASARTAVAARARERLAQLTIEERDQLLDLQTHRNLPPGGDDWLLREAIAPGVCAWRHDNTADVRSRWDYTSIDAAFRCTEHGL